MRANHARRRRAHLVIFFIFIVSNTAGLLTPLGDHPLFLGFLRGVPFHWTLSLFPQWALVVGILRVAFNIFDQYVFIKEDLETAGALAEGISQSRLCYIGRNNEWSTGLQVYGSSFRADPGSFSSPAALHSLQRVRLSRYRQGAGEEPNLSG
jgi:hypothetical protein